jgi:hypothetical protein
MGATCGSILEPMSFDVATHDGDPVAELILVYMILLATPAIGGFVIVGEEIASYSACTIA